MNLQGAKPLFIETNAGPQIGDALGLGILDAWNDGKVRQNSIEVLEFQNGYLACNSMARYFDNPDHWSVLDSWALSYASGRVLDIGTGAGRYALELQSWSGITDVTGIDLSPGALEVARTRGLAKAICIDWRDFKGDAEPYDTLTLMGNNLGLIAQDDEPGMALQKLAKLCHSGSRLIGLAGRPRVLPDGAPRVVAPLGHVEFVCRERYGQLASEWFEYALLEPETLERWCTDTGWDVVAVNEESHRWAAVLELR